MTDAVETMAYSGDVPWHGLGNNVHDKMTPEQICKAGKIAWTVSKQPVFRLVDKEYVTIKDQFMLTRDSDMMPLSMVGATWKPVQNLDAADFFKKFVAAGKMKMETAGSLWNGRYIWCLARITSADFSLGKSDAIQNYLLLCQPHYRGRAMIIQFTSIRVVCWNTLTYALGANLQGKGHAFRMAHSTEFDESVKEQAAEALGLVTNQAKLFKEAAILLSKKKAKADDVEDYFCEVLRYDPKKAEKKKTKDEAKEPRMLPHLRQALIHAPGQKLATAEGTWWGAANAVSYVVDHQLGRDRETALHNAWLGPKAVTKRRAIELAIKYAS